MKQTKKNQTFIYFRESALQSIISDVVTFGLLVLCIKFSRGDLIWTAVCLGFFFTFLSARPLSSNRRLLFDSKKELLDYLNEK